MKIDLHMHSTYSDGSDNPYQLVEKLRQKDINVMSLTDHDTIEGLDLCKKVANENNIQFVNGVELSTYLDNEVHILGYHFDRNSDILCQTLYDLAQKRKDRACAIIEKLAKHNVKLDKEKLLGNNSVGRVHFAKELIAQGYVSSINEAFNIYLSDRGCAYVPSRRLTPRQGVELICKANGKAVVAHPMRMIASGKANNLVKDLKEVGLWGIECYYPTHELTTIKSIMEIAQQYNLFLTGGTDYHGKNKPVELDCIDVPLDRDTKIALGIEE